MADRDSMHDDGYAQEQAIANNLERYLRDSLAAVDPPVAVGCRVDSENPEKRIKCQVDVDRNSLKQVETLLGSELSIISQLDQAVEGAIKVEAIVPAIVKQATDIGNQVFQLEVNTIDLPPTPEDAKVLPMPSTKVADPNFGKSRFEIEHVIVLIHGIRDIGAWQSNVSEHLVEAGTVVEQIRYGKYLASRFLCPIDLSGAAVQRVLKELQSLRHEYPNARMSLIAHSFGTYVTLKVLEKDKNIELWKIVFCGSVANDRHDWSELKRRVGDGDRATKQFILNDCGTGDVWPVIGAAFGWHYGMAGATGFSEGFVTNRFHKAKGGVRGGHGLYFDPDFVREHWRPFLINDEAPAIGDGIQGEHLPWLVKLMYESWARFICKLLALVVWLLLFATVGLSLFFLGKAIFQLF
ncbi:hypothetical protein [Planctomycetes bacterium TBK1r]